MRKSNRLKRAGVSRNRDAAIRGKSFEALEERTLLSWGTFPQLIDQDLAVSNYGRFTGAGQTIVNLDSGINASHPVFSGKIYKNAGEVADGRDNDGNGYVDDLSGWNFVSNNNNPSDDQGHGTMTAAFMVANRWVNTGNNSGYSGDGREYQGVASGAKVLSLKVVNSSLQLSLSAVEKALKYVIANRARFNITAVNMSLDVGQYGYSMIADELATLWNSGVFIAAASGNGGDTSNNLSYPAKSPYAAAVGAVNSDGSINYVTSRGSSLDVLAPGSKVPYPARQGTQYWLGGNGTSYSTPFATAAGAVLKQVNPSFSANQIAAILRDSGQKVYDSATRLTFSRLDLDSAIQLALSRSSASSSTSAPAPSAPAPTTTTSSQSPFSGTPIYVPGTIQAENYDNGGEGISYHDGTSGNLGGKYRSNHVDIESTTDSGGGYNVCHTRAGEWLEYTINIGSSGYYDLGARVANTASGGRFHIEIDNADKTGAMYVPNTGGWQRFSTLTKGRVYLASGRHTFRVEMDAGASNAAIGNFNYFTVKASGTATASSSPASSSTTSSSTALRSARSTIQAESYSGSKGIANSGYAVGGLDAGDYLFYKGVDFGTGVKYFTARVAVPSTYAGRQIQIRVGGPTGQIIGALTVKSTGAWGAYKDQTAAISGTTGVKDIYLTFSGGATANMDYFRFS